MPKQADDRYSEFDFAKGWGSVSTICGQLEKFFLYRWYAVNGWEGANRIKEESQAIGNLIDHEVCQYFGDEEIKDVNRSILEKDGEAKTYFYQSIRNFHKFTEAYKPKSVFGQKIVYSKKHQYIGTFDRLVVINKKLVLIDWKATNTVDYPYKMQLEAYYRALTEMVENGIIDLGDIKEWDENPMWIVQMPKKEEMNLDRNVIKLKSKDVRFNNFLNLLGFYYGRKADEGEDRDIKKEAKKCKKASKK